MGGGGEARLGVCLGERDLAVKLRALGARKGVTVEALPPLPFTHSPPAEMPPTPWSS